MVPNPEAIRNLTPVRSAVVSLTRASDLTRARAISRGCLLGTMILAVVAIVTPEAQAQPGDTVRIAFLSDTQDPIWYESLVLKTYHNSAAREMILGDILERRPRAVVHLGDMVSAGSNSKKWNRIDQFTDSLRAKDIKFHPIRGNHEYYYFAGKGNRNFERRFPDLTRTGVLVRYGTTAIVLLNSYFLRLTQEEQESQSTWYRETLSALDADSSVEFVVVGCHHPPYTNSTIVPPSSDVDTAFVPAYLEARKAVLFMSGHAHAYEHYRRGGKDFLVIGGGGGLLQPLLTGTKRRYEDLFASEGKTRMYHYLWCEAAPGRLRFELKMIRRDLSGFEHVDSLEFTPPETTAAVSVKKKTPSP